MAKSNKGEKVDGWVILDKAVGISSTQALNQIKRLLKAQKAGHAGTLDPFASGVLPLAFGNATKTVPYIMDGEKEYEFTIEWGISTDSLDTEGTITETSDQPRPSIEAIKAVLPDLIGNIEQMPPIYSALKIKGERAYAMARRGEEVILAPRQVKVWQLELLDCPDQNHARFYCHCGKGVYIRSLVRDIGLKLGIPAVTKSLRRLRVGPFKIKNAILLEDLDKFMHKPELLDIEGNPYMDWLLPIDIALDGILAMDVTEEEEVTLRKGQSLSLIRKIDYPRIKDFEQNQQVLLRKANYQGKQSALIGWAQYREGSVFPLKLLT